MKSPNPKCGSLQFQYTNFDYLKIQFISNILILLLFTSIHIITHSENFTLYISLLLSLGHVHIPLPHTRMIDVLSSLVQEFDTHTIWVLNVLKRKHTNPINVRSFSSSKERVCWPMGIHFKARARHLNVSFPAKLTDKCVFILLKHLKNKIQTLDQIIISKIMHKLIPS